MGKKGKKIKQENIVKPRGLFAWRLGGKTVTIQGVEFDVQALPSTLIIWSRNRHKGVEIVTREDGEKVPVTVQNLGAVQLDFVKFGVKAIRNLTDEDGEPVDAEFTTYEVMGRRYPALTNKMLDGFDPDVLDEIFLEVNALCVLVEEVKTVDPKKDEASEADGLDFTTASGSGA